MTDKYSDKPLALRFFHRYTGFIVLTIFAVIITVAWFWYDSTTVYFETWSCHDVRFSITPDTLQGNDLVRYNEIVDECIKLGKFAP